MENFLLPEQNQKLSFDWKIPFNLAAERSETATKTLTYPKWWTLRDLNS